jgi:hypothetical protein
MISSHSVVAQAIRERVMEVPGGESILLAAGFEREGEFMVFPPGRELSRPSAVLTQLQQLETNRSVKQGAARQGRSIKRSPTSRHRHLASPHPAFAGLLCP